MYINLEECVRVCGLFYRLTKATDSTAYWNSEPFTVLVFLRVIETRALVLLLTSESKRWHV